MSQNIHGWSHTWFCHLLNVWGCSHNLIKEVREYSSEEIWSCRPENERQMPYFHRYEHAIAGRVQKAIRITVWVEWCYYLCNLFNDVSTFTFNLFNDVSTERGFQSQHNQTFDSVFAVKLSQSKERVSKFTLVLFFHLENFVAYI